MGYAGLIFSSFENLEFDCKFNSEVLKEGIIEIVETSMGLEEGKSKEIIAQYNEMFKDQLLAMGLGMLEQFKPFFAALIPGIKEIDFDKICFEILVPSVRAELKISLLLPGLNDFVSDHITN
jgi:hypothetical protein